MTTTRLRFVCDDCSRIATVRYVGTDHVHLHCDEHFQEYCQFKCGALYDDVFTSNGTAVRTCNDCAVERGITE